MPQTITLPLNKGFLAIIDAEDLPLVQPYTWHAFPHRIQVYAVGRPKKKSASCRVYLHRLVMNAPSGVEVDHKNGNGLDNRKANLRLCDGSFNRMNQGKPKRKHATSQYRGVSYVKHRNQWNACLTFRGKRYANRNFKTEREAALFYNTTVIALFGPGVIPLNDVV